MGTRTFVNDRVKYSPTKNISRGIDVPLALTVVALIVFGLIMLYSASFDFSFNEFGSSTYMFTRQVKWLALGLAIAFGLSRASSHRCPSGTAADPCRSNA